MFSPKIKVLLNKDCNYALRNGFNMLNYGASIICLFWLIDYLIDWYNKNEVASDTELIQWSCVVEDVTMLDKITLLCQLCTPWKIH